MSIKEEIEKMGEETEEEASVEPEKPLWQKIVFADSLDKPLSDYRGHPLNFDGKDSTSRIIRGGEGILGNLNKAMIDIIIGAIQKAKEIFEKREGK